MQPRLLIAALGKRKGSGRSLGQTLGATRERRVPERQAAGGGDPKYTRQPVDLGLLPRTLVKQRPTWSSNQREWVGDKLWSSLSTLIFTRMALELT